MDPGSASSRMNHYEKGRHAPDIETLQRLAEELNVPLNFFFCHDDVSAELACLIGYMNDEQRQCLLEQLQILMDREVSIKTNASKDE